MPGHAPRQQRILGYPARVILGTLMSLAVAVAERRIRKALVAERPPARTAPGGHRGDG
jgi:hypothetical protein